MALAQDIIDSYSELDLRPGATEAQAKAAYYRLAKALHPDLHPGALGVMMGRVNKAYKKVMEHLASQQKAADIHYRHFDLEEFIGTDFINRKRPADKRKPAQEPESDTCSGANAQSETHPVPNNPRQFITLRRSSQPNTRPVNAVPKPKAQWRLMELAKDENGLVYRVLVQGRPRSMDLPVRHSRRCPLCSGTGRYTGDGQTTRCPSCGGRGAITSASTMHVELPPHWGHGERLPVNLASGDRATVELMTVSPGGEA